MGVTDAEQPARHLDRQVEFGAGRHVADVHVAAHAARRHHGVGAGFGRGKADGAAEGLQRHPPAGAEHGGRHGGGIILPDVEGRVLELVCQQAEAGNIGCPAPARRREIEQRHLDGIAGLRTFDEHRTRDGVHLAEVECLEVGKR